MICFLIDQLLRDNPNWDIHTNICECNFFLFASGYIDTQISTLHIIHKITIEEDKADIEVFLTVLCLGLVFY